MTILVADVGGTNSRIAVIRPEAQAGLSSVARYENAAFSSFYETLSKYCADQDLEPLQSCCIAVAGPVTSGRAQLTNLRWSFESTSIAAALPFVPGGPVHLVNDLAALGFALPDLTADQLHQIRPARANHPINNQALVAGMGTGFNICLVKVGQHGPVVAEAELGQASLPGTVNSLLAASIGKAAEQFAKVEDLFSGRGLSNLYRVISNGARKTGPQILSDFETASSDHAIQAVDLLAQLLGIYARELVFQYLPFGGIHFAGGAARGILGSAAKDVFLQAFDAPGSFAGHLAQIPVRLITDDAAALTGAAHVALSQQTESGCPGIAR